MNKADDKMKGSGLSIDRAAFILLRVKRVFRKKKQQLKEKNMPPEIKPVTTSKPPPLLRSRTLPSIVVPGLSILQAQIDAKYKAGQLDENEKAVGPAKMAYADDTLHGRCNLAYHRLSSPEPAANISDSMRNLPSSNFLGAGRSYRLPSNSSLSSTALNRLAKLLNQRGTTNLEAPVEDAGIRRLSWEKKIRDSPPSIHRSSSIDSMVDITWQSTDPIAQQRRLQSPLLCRTERLGSLVSPSLGRRLKGNRALTELPTVSEPSDVSSCRELASRSSTIDLGRKGMDFWVDGFRANNKKKLDKINKINIHLHALFSAVEHGHVEKARTILESTDVDVNSLNGDGLTPLDVAVLTNHRSLAKMLLAFGAQEGNHFQNPEKLGIHLKNLIAEAEKRIQDINGGLLTPDQNVPPNINNNRSFFSGAGHHSSSSVTGCHGGAGDSEKELILWERKAKGLKKMLLGFDQTRPPEVPQLVAVDVTGTNSVLVRFQGPEHQDSSICTKFKVQWSKSESFTNVTGEKEIADVKQLDCTINDLSHGKRYWFRMACGNLKGYGHFKSSTPSSVVPSSWRDGQKQEPRFAGRLHQLDDLFSEIRNLRPENASEIKDFSDQEKQGETPALQRRNQKKKTTIKQLFTVTGKFHKNLKRGIYIVSLFYHDDRVLVTNEDFLPAVEVDETYPSSIYNDLHWLMKVACTWSDVKSLKQDMEKNLTSTTSHFRIKLLQAAQQMQSSLSTQDLGQLYYRPIRDAQGTLVFCTINHCSSPKSISVLNLRWTPISKIQKKVFASEESNISELLMTSIPAQITYHQHSNIKLTRGLYLGYLKMRSSVDLIQIIVPSKTPNVLPHCKIRDNPHISSEEWEWLKRSNARHKTSENGHNQTREEAETKNTEQQQIFVEQVANAVRRLFSYLDVNLEDAMSHRLYDLEVVDLNPDISFMVVVPPAETSCSVPGQKDVLLERGDLMSVPVQVFEMVHLGTYQPEVISRYSRLSCILELDVILAQHSHREAFSTSEVQITKNRLSRLQELQTQLNQVWKSVRWIMDVMAFARDRGSSCVVNSSGPVQVGARGTSNPVGKCVGGSLQPALSMSNVSAGSSTPGVSMKHLLALTRKKESSKKSPNRLTKSKCLKENHQQMKCEKRTLLQIPDSPKDPKLLKSNLSWGSWPGPGVENGSCLLETSLSKSEQHLNVNKEEGDGKDFGRKYSGSDMSGSSRYVTIQSASNSSIASHSVIKFSAENPGRKVMTSIGNRLPFSKSEDHLLISQDLRSFRQSREYRDGRNRSNAVSTMSVSATNSPLLPPKNLYNNLVTTNADSSLSIANTNTSGSMHSISSDESTAAVVSLPVTIPMRNRIGSNGSTGSVQPSASLLSLAKPIIPASSGTFPKSKIPIDSFAEKPSGKRTANPPTSLLSTGSILSGNAIPVNISQIPARNPDGVANLDVPNSLYRHISSSLPSFNPVPGLLPGYHGCKSPVRQRQSPVKSPAIDSVLLGGASSKRSDVHGSVPPEIDFLHHPGVPLDSPPSRSPSSTTVSQNSTLTGSLGESYPEPSASLLPGNENEGEDAAEDIGSGVKVPSPTSGVLQVYAAYETGLAAGTSLKLYVTPRTSAREVVDLVVKQLNMAVLLKGKDGPIYLGERLKNFCLVAVIGARERCLRDDFKPLQLQNPWKKGRLYVRQKQDVLAALEHSSRQSAFL